MLSTAEMLEVQRLAVEPLTALTNDDDEELRTSARRLLDDVARQVESQNGDPEAIVSALTQAGSPESLAAYRVVVRSAKDRCGISLEGA